MSPTCSLSGREFFSFVAGLAFPLRQSLDSGVAQGALTAETRDGPPSRAVPLSPCLASEARGVGHALPRFTAVTSPSPESVPAFLRL